MFFRALILILLPFHLYANEHALIVYTEEFPPYNFSVDNHVTGINIQLVKAACESAKIECVFPIYPWKRAMKMALAGPNTGLVSTARTPDREKLFQWVGPFMSGQNCIYKLAKRSDIQISNIKEASQYIMGASTDSAYKDILTTFGFEKGKNLKLYQGKYSKIRPFAAQRVDIIIGSATTIEIQLQHAELELSDVVPVAIIDGSLLRGNYLALHPAIDSLVVERLQASLEQQISSGAAKQIELEFIKPIASNTDHILDKPLWEACMKESAAVRVN